MCMMYRGGERDCVWGGGVFLLVLKFKKNISQNNNNRFQNKIKVKTITTKVSGGIQFSLRKITVKTTTGFKK